MKPEYLSDLEVEKIAAFNADSVMREAVRKVILAGVYENGVLKPESPASPRVNFALGTVMAAGAESLPDEAIGRDIRTSARGIQLLELGFERVSKVATVAAIAKGSEKKGGKNRAE